MLISSGGRHGDITDFKIVADGKDISQAISSVHIFMSIFEQFWTAELSVNDTVNMRMLLPLKKGTKFQITVGTNLESELDDVKTYEFVLQSINNGNYANHMQTTYIINLMAEAVVDDNKRLVSEAYKKQYHDQIIRKIIQQYLPGYTLTGEQSDNDITCIIPNWQPLDACAWLTKSATRAGCADFVMFQNDNGSFHFASISSLFNKKTNESKIEFNRKPTNLTSIINSDYDYSFNAYKIFTDYFDAALEMQSGFYGSTLWHYDQIKKKMIKVQYNSKSQYPEWDDNELVESNVEAGFGTAYRVQPFMRFAFTQGKTTNEIANNWVSSRIVSMLLADNNKLIIQSTGVAGAWRLLGKTCKVNLPSQQDKEDDLYDKDYAGKYLITGVTQFISRDTYMINYSLAKHNLAK